MTERIHTHDMAKFIKEEIARIKARIAIIQSDPVMHAMFKVAMEQEWFAKIWTDQNDALPRLERMFE